MIPRRTVICLGFSQLVCWGITYYLIGGFGESIAADLQWSRDTVYGGFSVALVVMGLASGPIGRLIDRHGGRIVMAVGSLVGGVGCVTLAFSYNVLVYFAAWACLGLAMRLTLYDAAFAALARIGGPTAKQPISQITLLGGLASTVFWPLGNLLAEHLGWRGALLVYAGIALLTIPLYCSIPATRYGDIAAATVARAERPLAVTQRDRLVAGTLYALIAVLTNFLNSAMSAHMISILSGLGIAVATAVWIATLRGIGQSLSRLCEVIWGGRVDALRLNFAAALLLPVCFLSALLSGACLTAAIFFAFVYGAGNGILSITRGTLPLALFDHRTYGAFVGRLLAPSFFVSAGAPLAYAFIIDRFGDRAALCLSIGLALAILAAAALLVMRFRSPKAGGGDVPPS
jgi:predicted MFS family arabinose efflux permease